MTNFGPMRLLFLSALPLLLTSCIDFEGQTLSYRYDRQKDELRIFQVYERVYAEGKDGKLQRKEIKQLDSLIENPTTFFFDNWILVYSNKRSEERVAELKKNLATAEATQVALLNAELDVHKALLASVQITNGQFFLNDDKELCAYQAVTVSNVSRLIEAANRFVNLKILSEKHGNFDKETQKKIREFAKDGKWVQLEGNRLIIRFLQTRKDFAKGAKDRAKSTANGNPALSGDVEYKEPFVQLTFGERDVTRTDIQVDDRNVGKYNTLLLNHVRKHHEIKEKVDIEKLRKAFLAEGRLR